MNLLSQINDDVLSKNTLIFKKFKPIKLIGKGSFGKVYSVQNILTKENFAMKVESLKITDKILETEAFYLYSLQGFGFPKFISYGHNQTYNILIEELLDKSLDTIYIKRNRICPIQEACLIAIQLIERFEFIHSKNIIYRDIKPDNFLIGKKDPNVIYVIDFGLCKKYRSSKTGKHLLPKRTGKFNGTMKYASINALLGKEQSRRDDLIALGYMIIFFVKKKLPWSYDVSYFDRDKYTKLIIEKQTDGNGSLFKEIPGEFKEYMKYNMNLKFEQKPNYEYLKSLFKNILFKMNLNFKNICFNWINNKNRQLKGYPKNSSKRKSNSYRRIMENLRENSLKTNREGKSQDAAIINDNFNIGLSISPNKAISNIENIGTINDNKKFDENKANKNKKININLIKKEEKQEDIKEIYREIKTNRKLNKFKIMDDIKNNSIIHYKNNKIIKISKENLDKLKRINSNFNSPRAINFNSKNIIKRKNKLSIININTGRIGPKINLNFSNFPDSCDFRNIIFTERDGEKKYNDLTPKKNINFTKRSINISNYSPMFKRNIKNIKMISNIRRKSNDNYRKVANLDNTNEYLGNNNKNNLLYKPKLTTQNIGVMIINNYKNKGETKYKKLLINPNKYLSKSNSSSKNHKSKNTYEILLPKHIPFKFKN